MMMMLMITELFVICCFLEFTRCVCVCVGSAARNATMFVLTIMTLIML